MNETVRQRAKVILETNAGSDLQVDKLIAENLLVKDIVIDAGESILRRTINVIRIEGQRAFDGLSCDIAESIAQTLEREGLLREGK